jgi:hypothetical protein
LLALVVLLSTAMSVQALESKTIKRHNGASAYANWDERNGDITTSKYLSVTETNDGTDIYLDVYTWGPDYWSDKSGSMFTQDDVFKIDKKLNSASLSDVEIDVYDWNTGVTEALTVKADWIGKGDISGGSSTSSSKNGDYVWKSSDSSKYRDASVTGSINGLDLGASSYASLSNFKNAYMSMEK